MGHRGRTLADAIHRRSAAERDGESGETLVELLMTVFLMGTAIVALLATTLAVIVSAHGHRRRVRAENEATSVIETIDRMAYVPCAEPDDYEIALDSVPDQYVGEISEVRYLVSRSSSTASYQSSCSTDQGSQEITVTITVPGRYTVHADVVMVKRDDTCPTDATTRENLGLAVGDRC